MGREITLGNPPFAVEMRRSARARRLSLRVSRLTGAVTLTLPRRASEKEALAFLKSREDWIAKHLAELNPARIPGVGDTLPLRGEQLRLMPANVSRPRLSDGGLLVPDIPDLRPVLRAYLKTHAREALVTASDHYADRLGRSYAGITLRDTRSRWGSCSARGGLNYSWRLIMAPPDVLDYVAAHEVAHLVEMNHSPAFWATVESVCPGYRAHRQWLRDHGHDLHRVQLTD